MLRQLAPQFILRHPRQAVPQVQSTLAKLSLCRTAPLGGRKLKCKSCEQQAIVYNSCGDRHCPRCTGTKRADWLAKTEELLLPQVSYFQVVFTLPDLLSSLALGNRREVYGMLLRSAWHALQERLREEQGIEGAALLVLHTWNHELDHHPHAHALVPGGGPLLDGSKWITTRHPQHRRRKKPYLVNNEKLAEKFQKHFVAGLKRLHAKGLITFEPPILPGEDEPDFAEWLDRTAMQSWNVYIEAPPKNSQPQQMVKYLARYLTGGPISDRRLISHEQGQVTFWARSKNKRTGNQPRPFPLPAVEFVRRWAMHILPKGFTKTRCYGGFSCRHRQGYLQRCRTLLQIAEPPPASPTALPPEAESPERKCPRCDEPMICVEFTPRASWRDLFREHATCPYWYQPSNSIARHPDRRIRGRSPPATAAACTR